MKELHHLDSRQKAPLLAAQKKQKLRGRLAMQLWQLGLSRMTLKRRRKKIRSQRSPSRRRKRRQGKFQVRHPRQGRMITIPSSKQSLRRILARLLWQLGSSRITLRRMTPLRRRKKTRSPRSPSRRSRRQGKLNVRHPRQGRVFTIPRRKQRLRSTLARLLQQSETSRMTLRRMTPLLTIVERKKTSCH